MNKLLKSITIPLFCLFAGGSLLPSAHGAFDAEKMQESSVRIVSVRFEGDKVSGIGTGTGFLINEKGNVVTNQHVVNGAGIIYALRRMGNETRLYKCTCEPNQQSKEVDLAVLTTTIKGPSLKMNTVEPKLLAPVYTMGYPGIADDGSDEIFFHRSRLAPKVYFEDLREGVEVQFETRPGEKGPQAFNLRLR